MLHIITGQQGSGKTLFLVKKALEYHKKGKTVYSNVHLNFPYKQLDYNDIVECRLSDGMVILDEGHQLLSSRNSMSKVSKEITNSFISMLRKQNVDLYISTQQEFKIDCRIRWEKDYLYACNKYAYVNKEWIKVLHNQDLDKDIPIMISLDVMEMYTGSTIKYNFIGNEYFKLYDSRQIIRIKGLKI